MIHRDLDPVVFKAENVAFDGFADVHDGSLPAFFGLSVRESQGKTPPESDGKKGF